MIASNLLEWLAITPFRVALLVIGVPALVVTTTGLLLVRRIFADELATADRVAGSKAGYMAETYGVLLGLMLAAAFASYQEMQDTILGEGQSLKAIMHVAPSLPGTQGTELAEGIRRYAQHVVEDEWPKLAFGDGDEAAENAFQRLFEIAARPPGDAGFAASFLAANQVQVLLQDVLRRRSSRLAAGPGRPLAELLSEVLIGLTLAAVAIPWFLESRSIVLHLLLSGMLVLTYIALITLSVELLYPFAGQVALAPEPFQALLR
jgi:hypothetical protein